jgi:hypothetical protein
MGAFIQDHQAALPITILPESAEIKVEAAAELLKGELHRIGAPE